MKRARGAGLDLQTLIALLRARALQTQLSGTALMTEPAQRQRLGDGYLIELLTAATVLDAEFFIGAQIDRGIGPGARLRQLTRARRDLGFGRTQFGRGLDRARDTRLQSPDLRKRTNAPRRAQQTDE